MQSSCRHILLPIPPSTFNLEGCASQQPRLERSRDTGLSLSFISCPSGPRSSGCSCRSMYLDVAVPLLGAQEKFSASYCERRTMVAINSQCTWIYFSILRILPRSADYPILLFSLCVRSHARCLELSCVYAYFLPPLHPAADPSPTPLSLVCSLPPPLAPAGAQAACASGSGKSVYPCSVLSVPWSVSGDADTRWDHMVTFSDSDGCMEGAVARVMW